VRAPRPRDPRGRPLPRDSAVTVEPDPEPLPPEETLDLAQQLLDAGRAFRAHEVLEARWKTSPDSERELWRGLAQLAVGVTHHQRGNRAGRLALLRRAALTLSPYAGQSPFGVAVDELRSWAEAAGDAGRAANGALPPMPPLRRPSTERG
jgi:uncharacterized membrane-anchored protein